MTVAIAAHFDGKVIVPDEPLDMTPGQALKILVEMVGEPAEPFADLLRFTVDSPDVPSDLSARHDDYLAGRLS